MFECRGILEAVIVSPAFLSCKPVVCQTEPLPSTIKNMESNTDAMRVLYGTCGPDGDISLDTE
jgi:hypothetical protein